MAVHSHFHEHGGIRHSHAHQDGDAFTAHAHSAMLIDPPAEPDEARRLTNEAQKQLVLEAMRTGDWSIASDDALDAAEKMASHENPMVGSENLRGDVRAHTRGGDRAGKPRSA